MDGGSELVHATCVALGHRAALLRGPPGSGKSDLALRFLFLARRGPAALEPPILIADDQVWVRREGPRLMVEAPETIRGKLEVRGLGIVDVKMLAQAELVLIVDLVRPEQMERMPETGDAVRLMGVEVPRLQLAPFEASAPIKLALAVARAGRTPRDH